MIALDKKIWDQGIRAGFAGKREPWLDHLGQSDAYSYFSGWIEGEAARRGYEVTLDVAKICGLLPEKAK